MRAGKDFLIKGIILNMHIIQKYTLETYLLINIMNFENISNFISISGISKIHNNFNVEILCL